MFFIYFFCQPGADQEKSYFPRWNIGAATQKTTLEDDATNKLSVLNVSPVFGKAIKENLIWGLSATVGISNRDYNSSNPKEEAQSYGIGTFLRKYKQLGKSGFSIFAEGSLLGAVYRDKMEYLSYNQSDDIKGYNISLNVYPGISYAVSKRLQLETGFNKLLYLNYFSEKNVATDSYSNMVKANGFSISTSLDNFSSLYVGFRVLIN